MFDDDHCRSGETANRCNRSVQVKQVIKREFFAVQHLCIGHRWICRCTRNSTPAIKSGLLMRILAITQGLNELPTEGQGFREVFWLRGLSAEIFGVVGFIPACLVERN